METNAQWNSIRPGLYKLFVHHYIHWTERVFVCTVSMSMNMSMNDQEQFKRHNLDVEIFVTIPWLSLIYLYRFPFFSCLFFLFLLLNRTKATTFSLSWCFLLSSLIRTVLNFAQKMEENSQKTCKHIMFTKCCFVFLLLHMKDTLINSMHSISKKSVHYSVLIEYSHWNQSSFRAKSKLWLAPELFSWSF